MIELPAVQEGRDSTGLRYLSASNLRQPRLLRRAKPLLGTLVEIACAVPDQVYSGVHSAPSRGSATLPGADAALAASEAAFAAIARVQRLMSRHEATSDLSRFNAAAPGHWTAVAPDTLTVFAFALHLSAQSGGIFDVCAACSQDEAGQTGTGQPSAGSWRDVEIDLQRGALRKHAPLRADLGGVAKGYAVDAAVYAMQHAGVGNREGESGEGQSDEGTSAKCQSGKGPSGWVNAGGDLRVFGDLEMPVRVRSPQDLSDTVACVRLRDRAAATSACYLQSAAADPSAQSVLRHGISRQPVAYGKSWTVAAPCCMAADALTKLVAATGNAQHPLLAHYAAQAWIF